MEKRIIELETKLTYFERTVQELNDVVYHQQKQIDALEKSCKELAKALRGFSGGSENDTPADEKPPHY
jgi:SlyX protein